MMRPDFFSPDWRPPDPPRPRWVPIAELTTAAAELAAILPADTTAIAAVPRSGLAPAGVVAMLRHLPLGLLHPRIGLQPCPTGWRMSDAEWPTAGRIVVIDDTIASGTSFGTLDGLLREVRAIRPVTTAVCFASPGGRRLVDLAARELHIPHLLEWNLFNSCYTERLALDFDGIICGEIPLEACDEAEGGRRYRQALEVVRPLYAPRRRRVPLVVSGRPKAYRDVSLAWLARHGVEVDRLELWPGRPEARFRDGPEPVARFKAKHYRASSAALFVESCPVQARAIADLAGKPTLCPATGEIWGEVRL